MLLQKYTRFSIALSCLIMFSISGCDFDSPYVPESAGSSTLTGRIVTKPKTEVAGAEILLRGHRSFASSADANGVFYFRDIPPGDYSLQVQKKPYLQHSQSVYIQKSTDQNMGDMEVELKGAIAGNIPDDKIAIVHGEVEVTVYIDGVPFVQQEDSEGEIVIGVSSTQSDIDVKAEAKITVYIDDVAYAATVQDGKSFVVEFIEPGIYNDVRIRLDSQETSYPLTSDIPVVVKSGQTRLLP